MASDRRWTWAALVVGLTFSLATAALLPGCSQDAQAMSPRQLEQQYGITNAYSGELQTPDGAIRGTFVPVRMPDGHLGELVVPADGGPAYFRDEQGIHGIELAPHATRTQLAASPVIVSRREAHTHPRKRSWQKELLIIGGSAGAGAAVGGLTGGKKGAGIGAAAGGVGGLIYDLATRKNP